MVNWCCRYYNYQETEFYYLQSRYYDPEICRFINADSFVTTDIDGLLSTNMFAYCENNPVMYIDYNGESVILAGIVFGVVVGAISGAVAAHESGGNILAGAVTGAIAGGICGGIGASEIGLLAGSLLCASVGAAADVSNQLINGVKWDSIDRWSALTSAVTSALSFGLGREFEVLMPDSEIAAQFVSSIKSLGMGLCANGLYNTYGRRSQTVGSATSQTDLEHWQKMTEHYRSQVGQPWR